MHLFNAEAGDIPISKKIHNYHKDLQRERSNKYLNAVSSVDEVSTFVKTFKL